MGLMTGHVDTEQDRTLVIMDVFPLPVEGTETTVMTESDVVLSYMTKLSDSLETVCFAWVDLDGGGGGEGVVQWRAVCGVCV